MRLELPDGKSKNSQRDLIEALDAELGASETEMQINRVAWQLVDAYLMGIRKFKVLNRWTGSVAVAWENRKGELDLRYEEVLLHYMVQVGRLLKMDITPMALQLGESLEAMRRASIANATLGYRTKGLPLDRLLRQAIIAYLKYGTVGLAHYETGFPAMPDSVRLIPARQLRGMPAYVEGTESLYGIARAQWVPLLWLQKGLLQVHDYKLKADPETDLRAVEIPWGGTAPDQSTYQFAGGPGATVSGGPEVGHKWHDEVGAMHGLDRTSRSGGIVRPGGQLQGQLEEICLYDDSQEYVARYILKMGNKVFVDHNFEEQGLRVQCPLQVARYTDTGRMFGRSYVGPLITFNDQIEKMFASLFKNIQELDMFGTLFVSDQTNIDLKRWKTGPRPRVEKFSADPQLRGPPIFQAEPHNTGTLPGKVAEMATGTMQRLSAQGPAFQGEASGRGDSAAQAGFLFNTGNIGMALPSNSLADMFAGIYARILQVAKDRVGPGDVVELSTIDSGIAGVIIDPVTGKMSLADNPLPDPWEVKIDIKDRTPRNREIRKKELQELYAAGLVDDVHFWLTVLEENLDCPGADRAMWETWRKAIWQIILLFRDGQKPGKFVVTDHAQEPNIQLLAVQTFMNRIAFSLASEEVQNAFEDWKLRLEGLAGRGFPIGLGAPEEIAQQEMAMRPPAAQGTGQV
jgi:hypothetical protein